MDGCSKCKYAKSKFKNTKEKDDIYMCRRYAPKPVMSSEDVKYDMATEWEFPLCLWNDWCGEFEKK